MRERQGWLCAANLRITEVAVNHPTLVWHTGGIVGGVVISYTGVGGSPHPDVTDGGPRTGVGTANRGPSCMVGIVEVGILLEFPVDAIGGGVAQEVIAGAIGISFTSET